MVKQISIQAELDKVLKEHPGLVVIDFFATWCGPCKEVAPQFAQFSEKYSNVCFLKIDVDQFPEATDTYKVSAMPTFVFLKGGHVVETVVGGNITKVEAAIQKHA
ncbi:Thioredoxin-domain-containing [Paragonimus heterotremus]|uniref:Thioredoxin n=1 Tax=Paragonimus heterotremus TaxID=100268 RepID=A0A8J4SZM1_9TREM|nr:Thioredoxin-domain-containing [Paragonimus heterotremus]